MATFDYKTIPGIFMHEGDREIIKVLSSRVSRFAPCNIVHIGIGWGGSLYCSRAGAPDANLYGVDVVGTQDLKGTSDQLHELHLITLLGDSRFLHSSFSQPIHFLYIDGDHHYEVLSQDILNWTPKIIVGGYVAFHDCKDCGWALDVNRAIADILSANFVDEGISGWSRYFRRER